MTDGLKACEEALNRLLKGNVNFSAHVNFDLEKLTPSVVSHEAGFDRGYLKSSRVNHRSLIAKIKFISTNASAKPAGLSKELASWRRKYQKLEEEFILMQAQRDRVLSQNIELWEKVRELHAEHPVN